jgi:hypothetical protein
MKQPSPRHLQESAAPHRSARETDGGSALPDPFPTWAVAALFALAVLVILALTLGQWILAKLGPLWRE